jgi:poly-beta-1,6-N-acetyl-D-glucosamine synthase
MVLQVTVGVLAYNEALNIGHFLDALVRQQTEIAHLIEILVVSSGSSDRSDEIVQDWQQRDPRVRLIRQTRREGKASAIQLLLQEARGEIVLMASADIYPVQNAVENLLRPFLDPSVGMAGAHPMPLNGTDSMVERVVHLMWDLHHRIALEQPKLGEMVAFRRRFARMPTTSSVDEATLEAILKRAGYLLAYVPNALVFIRGPDNVRDFLVQRRRIFAGHLWLGAAYQYHVPTLSVMRIVKHLIRSDPFTPRKSVVILAAIGLEGVSRILGWLDFRFQTRDHVIWGVAPSTKRLFGAAEGPAIESSPSTVTRADDVCDEPSIGRLP